MTRTWSGACLGEPDEYLRRDHHQRASAWRRVLPRLVRPVPHLRADGSAELRARGLPHPGAYAGWAVAAHLPQRNGAMFLVTAAAATATGAVVAAATELLLIRPLYGNPVGQILVTIGLDLALVGLLLGGFGGDSRSIQVPGWLTGVTGGPGADTERGFPGARREAWPCSGRLPGSLGRTRYGVIIRAGRGEQGHGAERSASTWGGRSPWSSLSAARPRDWLACSTPWRSAAASSTRCKEMRC